MDQGLMAPAGLDAIAIAKQNGSWELLDAAEALLIPDDLEKAFERYEGARDYFVSLSKSDRKIMLTSLVLARRPETRQKRIDEIAFWAGQQQKPKPL